MSCYVQEGLVVVDSPGVGESHRVSRQLERYMSRAFGFIYVINISNACSIPKDTVSQVEHINEETWSQLTTCPLPSCNPLQLTALKAPTN